MTPAERNALRRLQRLLDDEEYGPMLARLRGDDERRVLRLIDENRGREARAEIRAADARRREARRVSRRRQLEGQATRNMITRHLEGGARVYEQGVADGCRLMTDAELRFAATATRDELVERARQPPKVLTPRGDTNPFWYH
jgi:hypothetical protein